MREYLGEHSAGPAQAAWCTHRAHAGMSVETTSPAFSCQPNSSCPTADPQAAARRLSAPPAFGGMPGSLAGFNNGSIPLERQLQFASNSPASALPAVPEEETDEQQLQLGGQLGAAAPASVPAPPRERAIEVCGHAFAAPPCRSLLSL